MLAPPTGPRSDITKHNLEGHRRSTHVFSFLASVDTTPALKESPVALEPDALKESSAALEPDALKESPAALEPDALKESPAVTPASFTQRQ